MRTFRALSQSLVKKSSTLPTQSEQVKHLFVVHSVHSNMSRLFKFLSSCVRLARTGSVCKQVIPYKCEGLQQLWARLRLYMRIRCVRSHLHLRMCVRVLCFHFLHSVSASMPLLLVFCVCILCVCIVCV
jgi:hypothetical protein